MKYWLVKQEPEDYSWATFIKDGRTAWTGVRNFQARKFLREMSKGDQVLYYHSGKERCVVGVAQVARIAYADPTAAEEEWVAVDLAPLKPLVEPVSLEAIKADEGLQNLRLVRQSRLSVMPVEAREFKRILQFGKTAAP